MKYFFLTGEYSGDKHAAEVIHRLKKLDTGAVIEGWGGDAMQDAGCDIIRHISTFSVMGFWEIFGRLIQFQKLLHELQKLLSQSDIHVLVLVDFGGFNLRAAELAHRKGVKVVYYIPPKTWAWGAHRVKKLRKYCDDVLAILPFEERYYRNHSLNAKYVGNPSLESVLKYKQKKDEPQELSKVKVTVAVLPGSRNQEVLKLVNVLRQLTLELGDFRFIVSQVSGIDERNFDPLKGLDNVQLTTQNPYDILSASDVAIVTSGTATLETALLNVPQVVIYKTSELTYRLAKWLVKTSFISLVNIIAGEEVVRELIQGKCTVSNLKNELISLVENNERQKKIFEGYSKIYNHLGSMKASENAAQAIYTLGCS